MNKKALCLTQGAFYISTLKIRTAMRNQERQAELVRQKAAALNQFQQLYFQAMQLQQLYLAGKLPPEFTMNVEATDHQLLQMMYQHIYHLS